jgi:carbonic anhydrase
MSVTIERVQSSQQFRDLLDVLVEYERSLDLDLRHGAEPTLAVIEEKYGEPNAAFVAYVDGQPAGSVVAVRLDPSTAVMHHLYARPAFRKHGLGRSLVETVVAFARERGYKRVVLDTDRDRLEAAYRLYVALGFTQCEPYAPVDYRHPTYLEFTI